MEKFNDILRDLILDSGLSLRKLSALSKVSSTQYSSYLKDSIPKIDVAVRIADFFDCSLDYLFGLTEERKTRKYKKYDMSVFVSRYEKALELNKITHWKFSKQSGLAESSLRHWKLYGGMPTMESLVIIADGLSTSIDYLIGRY